MAYIEEANELMTDATGQSIATAIGNMSATSVGNLAALQTTDKTSLVGAVNEVKSGLPSRANQINYDNTSSGMAATQVQAAIDELNSGLTNWINVGSATASHYSIKSQTNNIYVNTALRRVRFVADITFNSYGGPDSWFAMFSLPNDLISYKPPYNVSQVILTDNCKRVAISKNNVNNVFAAALLDAIPEDDKTYVVLEWSY